MGGELQGNLATYKFWLRTPELPYIQFVAPTCIAFYSSAPATFFAVSQPSTPCVRSGALGVISWSPRRAPRIFRTS